MVSKKTCFLFTALFIIFAALPLKAAITPPVAAYSYLPETDMFRISPDAKYLAFRHAKNGQNRYVVNSLETGKRAGSINIGDLDPKDIYFIDNNRIIFVVSEFRNFLDYIDGKDHYSSAYIYEIKSGEVRPLLVPGYGIYKGQTGLGRLLGLSEDKNYAYMPAYVGGAFEDPTYNLLQIDLTKKRKPKTIERGTYDTRDYFVNNKGELIAREQFNSQKGVHSIEALVDGEWKLIFYDQTRLRSHAFVGLTPDFKSLVVLRAHNDRRTYYTMSLHDGTFSQPRFVKAGKGVSHVMSNAQRVVYGVAYEGFKPTYEFFDANLSKNIRNIQKQFPQNSVRIVDHSQDWKHIILHIEGNEFAGDYVLLSNGKAQHIVADRPQIGMDLINPVSILFYNASDGLKIPTLLTRPKHEKSGKRPLIVMPHGGPRSHDTFGFDYMAQFLANRGYMVIQPQFRGSSGFGFRFANKGYGEWGQKMQSDLNDAVNFAVTKHNADPERVCMVGWSYGGYAALLGAALNSDIYRCVVSINGVSDLVEMLSYLEERHGEDHEITYYWKSTITKHISSEKEVAKISPINHIENFNVPVLLFHAKDDLIVPPVQSENIYDALLDAGKKVELIQLDQEGHSINNNNASRFVVLKKIESFLKQHL
ncbi:alpha/beta hydrolase family protein [Gayadomonas joobiniege]|uniref:alpha/beta hydrolase family protein n=1 Tax=Gayadomonas joobiniege TaxID=1234606 RepID=UPI0003761DB7|nr:alpha/beta fold hydrolase [Gayadomonas joobiniege]